MIVIERKIGEVFQCCNVRLRVEKSKNCCEDCFFQEKESNVMNVELCLEPITEMIKGYCFRELRKDGEQVIFREIPKVQIPLKM